MNVVFTICSVNYLAQAKTLADSFLKHNPNFRFVIGLVDIIDSRVDLSFLKNYEILAATELSVADFSERRKKYNIMELSTSLKPHYIKYFFDHNSDVTAVIYLDPDMLVFDSFAEIQERLDTYNIILTPHVVTPIETEGEPEEKNFLIYGVYNLGFIALARSSESYRFLRWWTEKLDGICTMDTSQGLFVDQLWANLAPIFFEKVYIEKNPGYNMAYWNFHERFITVKNDKFYVNRNSVLVFFHFSHYDVARPHLLTTWPQTRYDFVNRNDLVKIYEVYREKLRDNKIEYFQHIAGVYSTLQRTSVYVRCSRLALLLLPPLLIVILLKIKAGFRRLFRA